jgi:hypothetical protein
VTASRTARADPIAEARLCRQGIAAPRFDAPEDVAGWMLAMQAQDYLGALWAIGLRLREATEAAVERAVAERRIVRTWPMRGTLHFVAAGDVRWLLALLAPRSIARDRLRLPRQYGLDDAAIAHARKLTERLLAKEGALTREALYARWEAAGIGTAQQRGINLVNRLAQEGVLCHGARKGGRHAYVLLDEWVPAAPPLPREEALARLALRYLRSRGPATAHDLAWWSGLTVKDAQAAIASIAGELHADTIDGTTYWQVEDDVHAAPPRSLHLLPPFDEFLVAYADRSAALPRALNRDIVGINGLLSPCIVVDGRVVGRWSRRLAGDVVHVVPDLLAAPPRGIARELRREAARYAAFLGKTLRPG